MAGTAVLCITRNGVGIGRRLAAAFPGWRVAAPSKLDDGRGGVEWFEGPASAAAGRLFSECGALVCVFSLGAVIRLLAPHLRGKKDDPAVVVVDDAARHAISALSGHLGGANGLAGEVARALGAEPVVTTAADVNGTIPVDLVGRDMGWRIEEGSDVTAASACVVNGEPVGVYQDAGSRAWWPGPLPANVSEYATLGGLAASGCAAALVITDRGGAAAAGAARTVVYRPPTLVVGIGLHRGTSSGRIAEGVRSALAAGGLSPLSVRALASVSKPEPVRGLEEYAAGAGLPVRYVPREELARVAVPNPSGAVEELEGTPSVSEAAALAESGGRLVVEKTKFPPDLTVAVARSGP